jgi:hypothetical protein
LICKEAGADPVIYGSFSHFYHTKDKSMEVHDIDVLIQKKNFLEITKKLKKNKIRFKYYPQWKTCVIKRGKLRVELDEFETENENLSEKSNYEELDFYGIPTRFITLKQLEEMYIIGYGRTTDSKDKILKKIKKLERFLGRKIDYIDAETIKNKNLSNVQKNLINNARVSQWGEGERKDFGKDYEPETLWFFIKDKNKIVALGGLRPIKISYLGKKYSLGGICCVISLERGKGYGKILMSFMKSYSYKTGKTILGFTGKTEFFKKAGLKTEKNFIKRFIYKNSETGEEIIDNHGDGIYYDGKDKFVSKVLKSQEPVYINVLHW